MRADASVRGGVAPRSETAIDDEADLAELMTELAKAGLVSAEMGDDGAIWYALTPAGEKVALQMAMRRDAHALVLGALGRLREGPD